MSSTVERSSLDLHDLADEALAGHDGHVDGDAGARPLVEVEGGAEVGDRAGHHPGVDPGEVAGEGDALVLEQLLELLLGHLTGRDLALEAVVLLAQAVVLGLQVALVEGAAPGVADGPEDGGPGVAHRSERREDGAAGRVDGPEAASVEGEQGDRREDEQQDGEARAPAAPRAEGHVRRCPD